MKWVVGGKSGSADYLACRILVVRVVLWAKDRAVYCANTLAHSR